MPNQLDPRSPEKRARDRQKHYAWNRASEDAFVAVNKLKDQGMFKDTDDARAEEALEYAIGIVRVKDAGVSTKDKLAAAKIILDFTKQKPVQRQQVAETAEAFLDNLIEE